MFAAVAAMAVAVSGAGDATVSAASVPLEQVEGAGFWREAGCWTCIGFGLGASIVIPPNIIWSRCASLCVSTF